MRANLRGAVALLIGAGMIALPPSCLLGQDTPQLIRFKAEASKDPTASINLRPNTATSVGLILQNPTEDTLRQVTVKLVQIVNEEPRVIVQTEVDKIEPKKEARLVFAKGKEGPDKLDLAGPPFKFQLWVEAKQPKEFIVVKRDVEMILREPRDYVTSSARFEKTKKKLSFTVKLDETESIIGPQQVPVQLDLGTELKETKKGAFKQVLTGKSAELFAEDVEFRGTSAREGRVYLTVDGYERAFSYPVSLTGPGDLSEIPFGKKIGARIRVPRYARPNAKFPVALELDGPTDADYRVEVGLDRAGTKDQFQTLNFAALRQQKVRLGFGPGGVLVVHTEVRDWQAEFDTSGVFGNLWFRVAVYKKDRKSGKDELVELLFSEEPRPGFASLETDVEGKRLFARVTQDESAAEKIEFVDLSKEWLPGKELPVLVKFLKREDHQAPVDKVLFFRGKVPADGKFNPDSLLAVGEFKAESGSWLGVIPAQDKIGPLDLTAQVTTSLGVTAVETAAISIKDSSGSGSKGLAKIKGKVAHGMIAQENLAVTLWDDKGKVKGAEKTNAKGEFAFEKVPPGTYIVYSTRPFPALIGQTKVVVPEGKDLIDNVAVRLLAK